MLTPHSIDADTAPLLAAAQHVYGVPPTHRLTPYRNLRHLLSTMAKATPDAVWLIHYDGDGARDAQTYAAFNARVHQAAGFLYDDLGVRRGDVVATLAFNHPDVVTLYFACWLLGAVVAPQNSAEEDRRIAFILRNSGARVLLAHADTLARARHIVTGDAAHDLGAPDVRHLVQFGGTPDGTTLHFTTETANRPNTFISTTEGAALDDAALLVYTSGTTGPPKGVVLSQYNLLADAHGIATWHGITGGQRLMNVLPIHHVNGIVVTLVTPLLAGASVVLNRAYSASQFWRRIAAERVHLVSVVPTLLQFSLEYAQGQRAAGASAYGDGVDGPDVAHLRGLICGAGTLPVALARDFEATFRVPVLHGYGLSETTCYSCFLPIDLSWDAHQHWLQAYGYPSIGCPIWPNEMGVFAPDGTPLPPGERGEIGVRGHNVMQGYFQRPDANASAFATGWFRTGDEGFYQHDDQGRAFYFITGRIKELINRGGVKFSPFDIEEVLLSIPGVRVGLAVAFPNTYYGEEVGAYVVPADGATLTEADVLAACVARLPFEKRPKVVVFGDEIPVTSTGKYQRLRLQPLFAAHEGTQFKKG